MRQIVNADTSNELEKLEHRFLESLAFSSFGEIVAFLDDADANYYLELPLWARFLAYRLVCLLEPNNAQIRQRASAGLRVFGPDWDFQAEVLQKEAEHLSSQLDFKVIERERDEG
jgi:hypothetical protein